MIVGQGAGGAAGAAGAAGTAGGSSAASSAGGGLSALVDQAQVNSMHGRRLSRFHPGGCQV